MVIFMKKTKNRKVKKRWFLDTIFPQMLGMVMGSSIVYLVFCIIEWLGT